MAGRPKSMSVMDRFWEKVELIPFHECWEWISGKNEHGYGLFQVDKVHGRMKAHRASILLLTGVNPGKNFVLHKCDNPGCVRPEHLYLGNQKDNAMDMISRGRGRGHFIAGKKDPRSGGGWNKNVTHCPRGHEYNEENTLRLKGRRHCRVCSKERAREYRKMAANSEAYAKRVARLEEALNLILVQSHGFPEDFLIRAPEIAREALEIK